VVDTMRIGLAGTGRIGAFHAKTLTSIPGVDELVLADLDTALAERVATDLGVSAAPSIDALLDSGLDAFVITAGTAAHAELLEAAPEDIKIERGEAFVAGVPNRSVTLARLALVMMVPMYYLLILLGAVRERTAALGLACGALAGPLAYVATPEWSVPLAGFAGGTAAYLLLRMR